MCDFCENNNCNITKAEVMARGSIIEDNASCQMQGATDEMPATYAFDGIPAYYSLSALVPDVEEEDPHAYLRYIFDEDEGTGNSWESSEVMEPLKWQTEKEFFSKLKEG